MTTPLKYVLFMYDQTIGLQTYINGSNSCEDLVNEVDKYNDSLYYCIYKYKTNSFHFGSKVEAQTYELHLKMKGKKNSGVFPFSPYDIAHKFESEHDWYYQTE
jgi:hypothetical protein